MMPAAITRHAIEEHLHRWYASGTPAVEEATIRVTADGQSIHW